MKLGPTNEQVQRMRANIHRTSTDNERRNRKVKVVLTEIGFALFVVTLIIIVLVFSEG